jgi:hypothetical protein
MRCPRSQIHVYLLHVESLKVPQFTKSRREHANAIVREIQDSARIHQLTLAIHVMHATNKHIKSARSVCCLTKVLIVYLSCKLWHQLEQ